MDELLGRNWDGVGSLHTWWKDISGGKGNVKDWWADEWHPTKKYLTALLSGMASQLPKRHGLGRRVEP